MKKSQPTTRQTIVPSQYLFILVLAILFTGCDQITSSTEPADDKPIETVEPEETALPPHSSSAADKVHVAFAGGGWRAHTGHSAWIISILDNGDRKLDQAFAKVGTISSNSGGSWFSTMLAFSDKFVSDIEAPGAITNWGTKGKGWLGSQKYNFDDTYGCNHLEGAKFLSCVFTQNYAIPTHWDSVVQNLIFENYPLDLSVTLSSSRRPWATDKSLLLASTMLTSEVVLNESSAEDKRYYQACLSPATHQLHGHRGAWCSDLAFLDVTPATFSSIPGGSGVSRPPFLKAINSKNFMSMGYTENAYFNPATAVATIDNSPLYTEDVPVVIAAAASSAAGGFAASRAVSGGWEISYEGEDEALSFSLADTGGNIQFKDASGLTVKELASQKFVRMADGGPVDNSGVAQLVSYLQQGGDATGFNIVAFDNVQELYTPGGKAADIGGDLANLFGKKICPDNNFCSGLNCTGFCVKTPNIQVFDPQTVDSTPHTWKSKTADTTHVQEVIYTKYTVTTVDNPDLGIKGDITGTLHAFTCMWSNADTAPQNKTKDGDFDAYQAMLNFIHNSLYYNKGEGLKYLEAAMGISQ